MKHRTTRTSRKNGRELTFGRSCNISHESVVGTASGAILETLRLQLVGAVVVSIIITPKHPSYIVGRMAKQSRTVAVPLLVLGMYPTC